MSRSEPSSFVPEMLLKVLVKTSPAPLPLLLDEWLVLMLPPVSLLPLSLTGPDLSVFSR